MEINCWRCLRSICVPVLRPTLNDTIVNLNLLAFVINTAKLFYDVNTLMFWYAALINCTFITVIHFMNA